MCMWNKTMRTKLERALRKLEKCNGDCKHCEKAHYYSAETERGIAYAWGCDILPTDEFSCISNSLRELRNEALECVRFELS